MTTERQIKANRLNGAKPRGPQTQEGKVVLIDGRLFRLELKRSKNDRLSPDQHAMHAELSEAGAVIKTAHGIDHALAVLETWGAFQQDNQTRKVVG